MVQQDVIDYIRIGKERGYSVNLLKSKLLENGFTMDEVNEAVSLVEEMDSVKKGFGVPGQKSYFKKDDSSNVSKPVESKPLVSKPAVSETGGGKRDSMKIAGFAGFILVGLALVFLILGFAVGILGDFNVDTISGSLLSSLNLSLMLAIFFLMAVVGLLAWFHFSGYVKLGGLKNSKGLKVSGWAVLISSVVVILSAIVILVLIYFQANNIITNSADPIVELNGLVSKVFAYSSIVMILASIWAIFVVLFSIFLMKIKEIKFTKLAAVFFLVFGLVELFSSGVLGYVLLYPGNLLNGTLSSGLSSMLGIIGSTYYFIFEFVLMAGAFVFGSLGLLDFSKSSRKL